MNLKLKEKKIETERNLFESENIKSKSANRNFKKSLINILN